MKIRILAVYVSVLLCVSAVAQNSAYKIITSDKIPLYVADIEKASASLNTLQCAFTQKKSIAILAESVISHGTLLYKKENRLCWEYVSPYYYLFILSGDKVYIRNDKSTSQFDTKSNALFKEISLLLLNSISGAGLIDPKKFNAAFYESPALVEVQLTPLNKTLKSFLSTITLYFDKKSYLVNTIEMIEPSGDSNTIVFSEVKLNQPVNDEKFMVR
jgi:outer membrane lipoprotein carrier protein